MISEALTRPAVASDASGITACVTSAYQNYVSRIGKPPGPMLDDYSQIIRLHQVFVVEIDDEIVAVLVLIHENNAFLLDNIAVSHAYQGAGLGRQLMELAESEARNQSFTSIELYTHELMTENIEIYQRYGYQISERRTVRGYPRVYMRKDL